jgi:hypothetical protein
MIISFFRWDRLAGLDNLSIKSITCRMVVLSMLARVTHPFNVYCTQYELCDVESARSIEHLIAHKS